MPYVVIPPYILCKIIDHGSYRQQSCVRQTLTHEQTLINEGWQTPHSATSAVPGSVQREIYDAHQTQSLPGTLVRSASQPAAGDVAVNEAWD